MVWYCEIPKACSDANSLRDLMLTPWQDEELFASSTLRLAGIVMMGATSKVILDVDPWEDIFCKLLADDLLPRLNTPRPTLSMTRCI